MTMHGSLAPIDVIALDLEGTLISNAMSQFPRRGLRQFLDFCGWAAPRVVVYTAVREARARTILCTLVREGTAPAWFGDIEYIQWSGPFKDLSFTVPDHTTVDRCLKVGSFRSLTGRCHLTDRGGDDRLIL